MRFQELPLESVECRLSVIKPLPLGNLFLVHFSEVFEESYPEVLESDGPEVPPGRNIFASPIDPIAHYGNPDNGLSLKFQTDLLKLSWFKQADEGVKYPGFSALMDELNRVVMILESEMGEVPQFEAVNLKYTHVMYGAAAENAEALSGYFSEAIWPTILKGASQLHETNIAWKTPEGVDLRHIVHYASRNDTSGYLITESGGKKLKDSESVFHCLEAIHSSMEGMKRLTLSDRARKEFGYEE